MANESPEDGRRYSREYYQRLKTDPAKYEALKRRRAENQRKRREVKKNKTQGLAAKPMETRHEPQELTEEQPWLALSLLFPASCRE